MAGDVDLMEIALETEGLTGGNPTVIIILSNC